jgi:hypothetical protein
MDIITTTESISVSDLIQKHQHLFYSQDHTHFSGSIFTEKRPLDQNVILAYTLAYKKGQIEFRRSGNFPESEINGGQPPLLEVLAWWIAFITLNTHHGMRSYVTPTSTFLDGERLGVYLLVNECLGIGRTFRQHKVVHPA